MPKDTTKIDNQLIEVNIDDLLAEFSQLNQGKKAKDEAVGALRAQIKAILETRGYHKKAFATVRTIADMSDTALADFWRTFKPMLDAYTPVIDSRIGDMVDKMENEADDMEKDL